MKSMKKSMFVTTILMVVLLIVALSTATFAWYTAQASVSVNTTAVTSASSTAASLAISKTSSASSRASEIELTMSGSILPMVPISAPVADTTYEAFTRSASDHTDPSKDNWVDPFFNEAAVNNEATFIANGAYTYPAVIATADSTNQAFFYVINTSETLTTSATVKVAFVAGGYTLTKSQPAEWATTYTNYYTRSGNDFNLVTGESAPTWIADTFYRANNDIIADLRVAIFVGDTAATALYKGTWSNAGGSNTKYGAIHQGDDDDDLGSYSSNANNAPVNIGNISPLSAKKIWIAAWFDGTGLTVDEADSAALFTVTFDKANAL